MPIDYSKAIIYKIHSLDPDINEIYVGSTCNFRSRKRQHKYCCNNTNDKKYNFNVYQYIRANGGWDKFMMTPIKQYSCSNKLELHIEERRIMEELNATLNISIPNRSKKEYNKKYRQENKEKVKEIKKQYREENKEKISERQKKYYENNKEKIKERDKKYRQENKEKERERARKYRQKNKDKINARKRELYALKKQQKQQHQQININ